MKIRRLYIGDFGIIRNQALEDIHSGIVVIGGLNRAGKSTFMEVLRHLGYGFPKSRALPPANSRYEVEADLALESGDMYNLRLLGHAEPVLKKITGDTNDTPSVRSIYHLDEFTYQQVFTISLSQLQKIPEGVHSREGLRLQSVLLGAGFSDIVRIPQIEDELMKEAIKIGGKKGNPDVKDFKPYYTQIREGMKLKDKALRQVTEYQEKHDELVKIEKDIEIVQNQVKEQQAAVIRLDVMKNNYETFMEKKDIESRMDSHQGKEWTGAIPVDSLEKVKALKDEYQERVGEYSKILSRFKSFVGDDNIENVKDKLLICQDKLRGCHRSISGLREKIQYYLRLIRDCRQNKEDILYRIKKTNAAWGEEDLDTLAAINTDQVEEHQLFETVEDYKKLKDEITSQKQNLDDLLVEQNRLKEQMEWLAVSDLPTEMKRYFYGALVFVALGLASFFWDVWFGILVGIAGIVGIGIYITSRITGQNSLRIQRNELESQLQVLGDRINQKNNQIDALEKDMEMLRHSIENYEKILGLPAGTSPDLIKDYFKALCGIQERLFKWRSLENEIKELKNQIDKELMEFIEVIGGLSDIEESSEVFSIENLIDLSEDIFSKIENWAEALDIAINLQSTGKSAEAMENRLAQLMGSEYFSKSNSSRENLAEALEAFVQRGEEVVEYIKLKSHLDVVNKRITQILMADRVREAFSCGKCGANIDNKEFMKVLEENYKQFISREEIEKEYIDTKDALDKNLAKLDELRDKRQSLRDEIERLSTTENLEKAQRQIDEARKGLRPLAYRYAAYSTAAFILEQVRKEFLERVKGEVLDKAGDILCEMTMGEYLGVLPPDNLAEADFQAVVKDGDTQGTVDILSRGTREQLFLAVRISRIMDIHPPLPVIIDDSLVNFDAHHIGQCIKIFSELSKTHQVFILTCHPELVGDIANCNPGAQFWKLEKGRFSQCKCEQLVGCLS